jgi:hypothetical protein
MLHLKRRDLYREESATQKAAGSESTPVGGGRLSILVMAVY